MTVAVTVVVTVGVTVVVTVGVTVVVTVGVTVGVCGGTGTDAVVVGAGVGVADAGGVTIGCTTLSKNSSWSLASFFDIPLDLNRPRTNSNSSEWGKGTSAWRKPIAVVMVATWTRCSWWGMSLVVAFARQSLAKHIMVAKVAASMSAPVSVCV